MVQRNGSPTMLEAAKALAKAESIHADMSMTRAQAPKSQYPKLSLRTTGMLRLSGSSFTLNA